MEEFKSDNSEALKMTKRLNLLAKRMNKIQIEMNQLYIDRQSICIHDKIRVDSKFIEGGYLNRAEYIKVSFCDICGKKLGESITFGGFA